MIETGESYTTCRLHKSRFSIHGSRLLAKIVCVQYNYAQLFPLDFRTEVLYDDNRETRLESSTVPSPSCNAFAASRSSLPRRTGSRLTIHESRLSFLVSRACRRGIEPPLNAPSRKPASSRHCAPPSDDGRGPAHSLPSLPLPPRDPLRQLVVAKFMAQVPQPRMRPAPLQVAHALLDRRIASQRGKLQEQLRFLPLRRKRLR